MSYPVIPAALAVGTLAIAMGGCAAPEAGDDGLRIVTSTNVYASLARDIIGADAAITSIIDNPAEDPHSYEATPQDKLTLSKADIVILNGGGYDAFMTTMLDSVNHEPTIVDAVETSGLEGSAGADHDHGGGDHGGDAHEPDEFNEHLWYSIPAMGKVAAAIESAIAEASPADADAARDGAEALRGELDNLHSTIGDLAADYAGEAVGVTEPVAGYLFDEIGLRNAVPAGFTRAVEGGGDVPAASLREALGVVEGGDLALLAVNQQASGRAVDELSAAARANGVPIVPVTETIPEGRDFSTWMRQTLDDVARALAA